jgi:hypothetical protein
MQLTICSKMTNKELFYFTGKCLTLEEHSGFRQEFIETCQADLIDWQQFVFLCSNHLILPVIYLKFRSNELLGYLPEELAEHLKNIYELNEARNQQILKQLEHITKLLNQSNIYPVFLKGSGNLLDGVYSDIGERILGDIDFLVPEKDYLISGKLFEAAGYQSTNLTPSHADIADMKHYPRLNHPDYAATIEIHRIPVRENYLNKYNSEIIDLEKKTVASLPGCFVLSEKHKIIHNFIHSQLSNRSHAYGIISFRDIYDLYLLSKRYELKETLQYIQNKQKAIAYFAFSDVAFGFSGKFFPEINLSGWLLLKKHSLNLNSTLFYKFHRTTVYLFWQIFNKYFGQLLKAMYSRKMRQSLAKRLGNRNWYRTHLDWYKGFFIQKHN